MQSKVHIIIAAENSSSRSLVVRKGRIRTALLVVGVLALVLVASLYVSVTSLLQQHDRQLLVVELENRVDSLSIQNQQLQTQVSRSATEKQELLSNAVHHLNERSSQLEALLTKVGVEFAVKEDGAGVGNNSGGPYIEACSDNSDDALYFSAQLIKIIEQTPLGVPSKGYLSSSFGRRRDPFNGRKAFHNGIDIAHFVGTKVKATADGVVASCGYISGYGNTLKVSHCGRFTTVFGHLDKMLVKKGAKIARGEVIATMGNTGRSTGPHLHYEIRDNGRPINPYGFTFLKK